MNAAETCARFRVADFVVTPRMEPRHECRGDRDTRDEMGDQLVVPTMEPRQTATETEKSRPSVRVIARPQWSGGIAAETVLITDDPEVPVIPQWGRGVSAAEAAGGLQHHAERRVPRMEPRRDCRGDGPAKRRTLPAS